MANFFEKKYAHMYDDLNLRNLCMLEVTLSLDAANIIIGYCIMNDRNEIYE